VDHDIDKLARHIRRLQRAIAKLATDARQVRRSSVVAGASTGIPKMTFFRRT
jgi:hypothetical protein